MAGGFHLPTAQRRTIADLVHRQARPATEPRHECASVVTAPVGSQIGEALLDAGLGVLSEEAGGTDIA